jgi:hypothetical protein
MTTFEADYRLGTRKSADIARRAGRVMPGGDLRTCVYHQPYPLTIIRAEGAIVCDADRDRYIDLLANYTSLAHGTLTCRFSNLALMTELLCAEYHGHGDSGRPACGSTRASASGLRNSG